MTSDNPCDWTSCAYDGKASGHSKALQALIYEYSCGLVTETPVLFSISSNSHTAAPHDNLDKNFTSQAFLRAKGECFIYSLIVRMPCINEYKSKKCYSWNNIMQDSNAETEEKVKNRVNRVPLNAKQLMINLLIRLTHLGHSSTSHYRFWLWSMKANECVHLMSLVL